MAKFIRFVVLAIGMAGWFSSGAMGATVEETLAAINKLPAKERQRRLEEGAKKEGNLVVYSNQGVDTIRGYADAFSKKYPAIKTNTIPVDGVNSRVNRGREAGPDAKS